MNMKKSVSCPNCKKSTTWSKRIRGSRVCPYCKKRVPEGLIFG